VLNKLYDTVDWTCSLDWRHYNRSLVMKLLGTSSLRISIREYFYKKFFEEHMMSNLPSNASVCIMKLVRTINKQLIRVNYTFLCIIFIVTDFNYVKLVCCNFRASDCFCVFNHYHIQKCFIQNLYIHL
jgi:pullulanase/glycogen debranching enzyme